MNWLVFSVDECRSEAVSNERVHRVEAADNYHFFPPQSLVVARQRNAR